LNSVKKIFVSIPWFHPAFRAGGPVQSVANMVNELKEGYEFYIFCGNTDLNNTSLENIETGKWILYNDHTKVWYAASSNRSSVLVNLVEKTRPDVLFIIGVYSWHFNLVPWIFCKAPVKILSARGMLHPGALSQKNSKKKIFLKLFKLLGMQGKGIFHATDETEKNHTREIMGPDVKIRVAGNFPRRFEPGQPILKKAGSLHLISIALISPMKNHLLVLQALETVTALIVYHICGPVKDMEYWQQCLEQIKKMPPNVTVHYHGDIQPAKVYEFLSAGQVFILPSKSENFGHAFYEALSAGKPVITSHFTPWQKLDEKQAGMNIELTAMAVKDSIEQFARMDQATYEAWSNAAVDYATDSINIPSLQESYRLLFNA